MQRRTRGRLKSWPHLGVPYTILYVQVLLAIAAGILIGHYFSNLGVALKPLGDGFISLIKMMIGPVIFCTIVHGIGSMRDLCEGELDVAQLKTAMAHPITLGEELEGQPV